MTRAFGWGSQNNGGGAFTWGSQSNAPTKAVVFDGVIPDPETTESFYWLAVNDLGFTPETGDILYYTCSPGLTVDGSFVPTIAPPSDASGFFYLIDVSTSTQTATAPYTIDQRASGDVDITLDDVTLAASGAIGTVIDGTLSETFDNVLLNASGNIGEVIDGTLSETFDNVTVVASGDIGTPQFILDILEQVLFWLPDNNVLTDDQLIAIITTIANDVGSTPENVPEILCKSLEAAAQANKAKATTHYGLTKEKVDRTEYFFDTGGKSPKDLWQDYIDSLVDICPLFGYNKPTTIGIVVSPGLPIDPLKNCKPPSSLY